MGLGLMKTSTNQALKLLQAELSVIPQTLLAPLDDGKFPPTNKEFKNTISLQ